MPAATGDDQPAAETLIAELDDLAADVSTQRTRTRIQEVRATLATASQRGLLRSTVRQLDPGDAAQAFVGSVVFAAPLLVEGGVFDIAEHLITSTIGGVPVFLLANTAFVVLMTHALLAWTGQDTTESHDLFGIVSIRLLMILGVSFVVAAVLMTVWGRVGDWRSPGIAIARINVLWTVGALGAGLGDIISEGSTGPAEHAGEDTDPADAPSDEELMASLHGQLAALESTVQSDAHREAIGDLRARTEAAARGDRFGQHIRKYTSRDIAEAFVGSIFFSIPFLVEDGVFDVAAYFLSFRVAGFPVFFLLNAAFVLLMVSALVYWAGPQRVQVSRPLFGIIPRRLVGITLVSFITAAALMTMWGRVDGWRDPIVSVARISAVWTVASFGAALGDILPGESSGDDINDDIADLGDRLVPEAEDAAGDR